MSSLKSFKRECSECGQNFILVNRKLKKDEASYMSKLQEHEVTVNGKWYKLLMYDCPFCSKRHIVQVDDEKTLKKLSIVEKMFASAMDGKPGKLSAFKKAKSDLAESRAKLEEALAGKVVIDDVHGTAYEIEFYHE